MRACCCYELVTVGMGIEAGATAGVILQVFSRQAAQGTAALAAARQLFLATQSRH